MYYDSGTWSNVPLIVVVLCKIFIDTWNDIFVISVGFCSKYNRVLSSMGVCKKCTPCIIFAFKVDLGNRV